jgi:enoyl-CoA hydratase
MYPCRSGALYHITQVLAQFYKTFLALRKLPIVSIAAINGAAVGGGMGLAAAADIRLAASNARLGYNFVKLGLSPGERSKAC